MNDTSKLYKCYKETCNKCIDLDDPFIAEDEYKDLLDADGKVQCPEGHQDCGIQELKPEDYPKQKKDNKKLFILIGGVLAIVIIVLALVLLIGRSDSKPKEEQKKVKSEVEAPAVVEEESTPEAVPEITPGISGNEITFANGNKYVGEISDGKPDGIGAYYFKVSERVSKKDMKERVGEPGDVLQGLWKEGYFINGKLFDSEGNLKEILIIGTN